MRLPSVDGEISVDRIGFESNKNDGHRGDMRRNKRGKYVAPGGRAGINGGCQTRPAKSFGRALPFRRTKRSRNRTSQSGTSIRWPRWPQVTAHVENCREQRPPTPHHLVTFDLVTATYPKSPGQPGNAAWSSTGPISRE